MNHAAPTEQRQQTRWLMLLKATILACIAAFIIRAIREGRDDFAKSGFSIANIHYGWLSVCSLTYILGMLPMALNWHRLLLAMGQPVPRWFAVQSHFISQLGKYVPGKAFVPAIRLGFLRRYPTDVATSLLSIVAETLAMMSVGAVVASVIIAIQFRSRPDIAMMAGGMALMSGLPVIPPVLRFALTWLQKRRGEEIASAGAVENTNLLTWSVIIPGWIGIVVGWTLLGVSMWAAMKALNLQATRDMSVTEIPWVTASYAISVVAGFLSMIPGGFGVREWALKELIEPSLGNVVAILAPVLHRLTILVSEILVSSILYFGNLASRKPVATEVQTADFPPKT